MNNGTKSEIYHSNDTLAAGTAPSPAIPGGQLHLGWHASNCLSFTVPYPSELPVLTSMRHRCTLSRTPPPQDDDHLYLAMEYLPGGDVMVSLVHLRLLGG